MLRLAIDLCVPALVFSAMFVVGMDLTTCDFRRVLREPRIVTAAIVGQILAIPAVAWILQTILPLQPAVAQGLLLVAACPGGAMASLHASLARSNAALSVSVTAISCLVAVLTTPLTLAALQSGTDATARLEIPIGLMAGQLIVLLILPVAGGMSLRHWRPEITRRHRRTLLAVSVAALALLLIGVIVQEFWQFAAALPEIGAAASALTVLTFVAGWAVGWVAGANTTDRFTLGLVFVVRNVGVATAIAVTILGRSEFAVFATGYFLVQTPLLLLAVILFRRTPASFPAIDDQSP